MAIKFTVQESTVTADGLKKARQKLGLSMADASRIARVKYRTWQNWESGTRPMPTYARTLIEYLEIKLAQFPNDQLLLPS